MRLRLNRCYDTSPLILVAPFFALWEHRYPQQVSRVSEACLRPDMPTEVSGLSQLPDRAQLYKFFMLLVPLALICIVHLTLTSLAFRNAETSDKKDGRNIITYGTELEAGAWLREQSMDQHAHKPIALTTLLRLSFRFRLNSDRHIPSKIKDSAKTSEKK